jgi:hypothetical protein
MTYDGRYVEGMAILRVIFTNMHHHLGRDSSLTHRAANNVANTLYNLGKYDEVGGILSSVSEVRNVSRPNPRVDIESCHPLTFDSL